MHRIPHSIPAVLIAAAAYGCSEAPPAPAETATSRSGKADDLTGVTDRGMATVPGGPFLMGCNEARDTRCEDIERPAHTVFLDAYQIDVAEVTRAAYAECVKEDV